MLTDNKEEEDYTFLQVTSEVLIKSTFYSTHYKYTSKTLSRVHKVVRVQTISYSSIAYNK